MEKRMKLPTPVNDNVKGVVLLRFPDLKAWKGITYSRGAGAAAVKPANHRFPSLGHAFFPSRMGRRLCATTARTQLDRGP